MLPEIGTSFAGRFSIESVLGEGAFGIVFLARTQAGRPVALKVLKPERPDGYERDTRRRFDREVAILTRLRSPRLVQVQDHGVSPEGLLYIAFEYLPGQDLRDLLKARGKLEPDEVRHILAQLLEGLEEAHREGLIHRDLKPENIRVVPTPSDPLAVKLIDFGLARGTDDGHPSLTKTGMVVGTPRYMSPEQLSARPLSPRSDLYSLGMVALELLLGEHVLAGNSLQAQTGRVVEGTVKLLANVPNLGPMAAVLDRMTALDPSQRYASATAALAALRARKDVRPMMEAPAPTGRSPLALFAAVALVASAALIGWWLYDRADRPDRGMPQKRNVGALLRTDPTADEPPEIAAASPDMTDADASTDATSAPSPRPPRPNARPSEGCGTERDEGASFDGRHLQYLPVRYDPTYPHPVVVLVRPDRQRPARLFASTRFAELADRERLIVLAPDDDTLDQGWKVWRHRREIEDVETHLREAAKRLCLDMARVFVVGVSDGARIAEKAACEPWVTAVAFSSFLYSLDYDPDWNCGSSPKPAIWLTPTQSVHIPVDGSESCDRNKPLPLVDLEAIWIEQNGCRKEPKSTERGSGVCREWECRHAPFVSCDMPGGYGWPGAPTPASLFPPSCFGEPAPDPAFPAEEVVWDFFQSAPPI